MKIKKYLYGFVSVLILLIMFIIGVIPSYANGFNNNAGGGGDSTASGNGLGGGAAKTLTSDTSGYRITLVSPEGEVLSKSIDILFSAPPSSFIDIYTASRAEDAGGQDLYNWGFYYANVIENRLVDAGYTQMKDNYSKNKIPRWFNRTGGTFSSDGNTFRDWFLPENAIDALSGLQLATQEYSEAVKEAQEKFEATKGPISPIDYYEKRKQVIEELRISIINNDSYGACEKNLFSTLSTLTQDRPSFTVLSSSELYNLCKPALDVFYNKFKDTADYKKDLSHLNSILNRYGLPKYASVEQRNVLLAGINSLYSMTSYADTINILDIPYTNGVSEESSTTGIDDLYVDEQKTVFNVEKYGWALAILKLEENNKSIFAKGNESGKEMAELVTNGTAYILVEPILFFKPQTTVNMATTFYGTAYNYSSPSFTNKLITFDSVALSGGNIFRGTNLEFFRGLILASDESELASVKSRQPYTVSSPFLSGTSSAALPQTYGRYTTARYRNDEVQGLMDDYGLAMQLYCIGKGDTSINTYDIDNNPTWDDYCESPNDKPNESNDYIQENKNRTFQIVKFYRINFGDGNYFEWSYYSQANCPHTVTITDEADIGWKLVDWYTSPSTWMPTNGGDPEKYPWESYVKGNNVQGTYSGTEEGNLVVLPEDPDNTLYLLYEAEEPSDDEGDKVTVIRVYDDENGDTDKVETEQIDENPYDVPSGGDYEYTETKVTPNSPNPTNSWDDSEGTSKGTPDELNYPDDTKTIYIHYQKIVEDAASQTIVLYENELSYNYTLKDLLANRVLISIYDYVPSAPYSYPSCGGHSCGGSGKNCPHTRYCKSTTKWLVDMNWTVAVKDYFNQNTLPFIKDWTYTSSMSTTGTASITGGNGYSYKVTPQASYLLIRNKNKDVVTLYPGKNSSLLSELSSLNLKENYTSSDTRYNNLRELTSTRKFYDDLYTKLDYTSARDTKLTWKTKKYGSYGSHTTSGDYNTSGASGHTPDVANDAYSKENNVETRYYLGEAGLGDEKPSIKSNAWQKTYDKYNSNTGFTEATLSFYPYLEYKYYKKGSTSAQSVMVTSSNLSTMKVFNAYSIGVYKKNAINANLDSTQWSTHARSLSFLQNLGVSDKKSVLPGGAIQDLDMGTQGDTKIGLTLWQACLPDAQVKTVQDGFKVSVTQAKNASKTVEEEIKKSISGYGLVQYAAEGAFSDIDDILDKGEELHENTSISFIEGNSGRSASDSKYYLRHDGTGSTRANFDCLANRVENQIVYTIKADTKGVVTLYKQDLKNSGSETKIASISKTQDVSTLINYNDETKALDTNTKLITNFVKCIERNKGTARNGDKWYNEAFDGVSVLMTNISFDVGFASDNAHRTNVLDPLLVGKASSKSDLYNFDDEDKVRSSVYITTDVSTSADDRETQGYMGTLKSVAGMGDLLIDLTDIQKMVYTKNFYIPNATVSDLN